MSSNKTWMHRSAAFSILMAQRPIALTDFLTNSTSTSEAALMITTYDAQRTPLIRSTLDQDCVRLRA